MADKLPYSPRKYRSLADLPPEPGIEESPLLEIPGAKELKRKALGALRDSGVPEVAVETTDLLLPESLEGLSQTFKKAGKAAVAGIVSKDFRKAQDGHSAVHKMLEEMNGLKSSAPQERVLDYSKFNSKDPSKRVARSEQDAHGRFHTLELSEGLTQDKMESLERLRERNPERYKQVIAKWRAKGILPDQE